MTSNEPGRSVLIVSTSARLLTQSAVRAGYSVDAIDLFGDEDTRAAASRVATVRASAHGFDSASLAAAITDIWRWRESSLVVFGSGFESEPELIERLFAGISIAGNPAATVRAVKDPQQLLNALAAAGISTPPVLTTGRVVEPGWLMKRRGASGGAHVREANVDDVIPAGCYAQRYIGGRSMSVLFLSDGKDCRVVGTCEHWCAQPDLVTPFQHSGLVSIALEAPLAAIIRSWGERMTGCFSLRGLWGMDFIVNHEGLPFLIEINPRPPAAMELFDRNGELFGAHISACDGKLFETASAADHAASAVFYAPHDGRLPESCCWPEGVSDRPAGGTSFKRYQPLCTVHAAGTERRHLFDMITKTIAALQQLIA